MSSPVSRMVSTLAWQSEGQGFKSWAGLVLIVFTVKSRLNCIRLEHVFTVKNLKALQIDVNGFSNLSTTQ